MKKLSLLIIIFIFAIGCGNSKDKISLNSSWKEVKENAKGQEVNLYMWSGSSQINDYIDKWVAPKIKSEYDVTLKRVPANDIKTTINKLLVEKKAGKKEGTIDLIWINGENFKIAKDNDLLWGNFSKILPNIKEKVNKKTLKYDFGESINGLEVPWGEAQFVFAYDSDKIIDPFDSIESLKKEVMKNPGKFTYPAPPDFIGSTFVRQMVYEVIGHEKFLNGISEDKVKEELKKVWKILNEIEPYLWRDGKTYPESSGKLHQLYSSGEVFYTMDYNPSFATNKISQGEFKKSTRTSVLKKGTLFNNHYLTIPYNSKSKAGAMVVANFLMSPMAQAKKADPAVWGDGTIIDMEKLEEAELENFKNMERGVATLSIEKLTNHRVPEISPEYVELIEKEWQKNVSQK